MNNSEGEQVQIEMPNDYWWDLYGSMLVGDINLFYVYGYEGFFDVSLKSDAARWFNWTASTKEEAEELFTLLMEHAIGLGGKIIKRRTI